MPATFRKDPSPSAFRKIAAAMWGAANDPTIYGSMDVDATAVLRTVEQTRAKTGIKITVTHLVARAVALLMKKFPEANSKVRWWGKIELRETVDLFLQVAVEGGKDLSGTRIELADQKSAIDLAREISEKADRIRKGDDPALKQSRGLFGWLPWFFVRPILRLCDWLVNELHIDLSGSGMPVDPFGSAMITSVGMFGIDTAFAPLTPIARCSMIVAVMEVKRRPFVVADRVEVRPVLRLCATFDHRIVDGALAGKMGQEMVRLMEDPDALVEALPETPTVKKMAPATPPPAAGVAPG